MAAVVVPRCRYSRHPTATVTAIEDAPCCCGRHIVLVATIVVLVVASSSVYSSSSGLWVPPCCRRHLWCPTLLLSSPLVHGGSMWQWVPPHSSLWLSPLVVVIELVPPPQLVLVAVGASLLVVMAVWCPPFILVAMGASSLILVVVWCPLGRHHGCASLVVIAAVSPVIVMAMGAPARPHGRVVPPWSLLSWPCGAPPVVVMAVPGCPHGCATHSSS